MANAFDIERCVIAEVERIPQCNNMLLDPNVSDPPAEITTCDVPPLDMPPEPPCPELRPNAQSPIPEGGGDFGYGGLYADNAPNLSYQFVRGNCCDFDLEISLSIPCPTVGPEINTRSIRWTTNQSEVTFGFSRDLETCDFELELDIAVHCPYIGPLLDSSGSLSLSQGIGSGNIRWVDGGHALHFWFDRTETCDYNLDIEIEIHCPQMGPLYAQVTAVTGIDGVLTFGFVRTADCDWELFIDLDLTCPTLTPTTSTVTPASLEESYITYGFTKTETCDYDLSIEFGIACPSLLPLTWEYTYLYTAGGTQGYVRWQFTKAPEDCEYTLELDALVPCPHILPQSTQYSYFNWGALQGYVSWEFTKDAEDCDYTLGMAIHVPCPVVTNTVNVTVNTISYGSPATGTAEIFTSSSDCLDWEWDITLNIPAGPQGPQGPQGPPGPQSICYCKCCGSASSGSLNPVTDPPLDPPPMMLGADVFAAPPPAIIQTATDGETVYGLAYPVFMPEARVNDQLYVTQAIPAGELTEITVKLDEAFLSICQQGTVDVVSIVCDRVASVGGRVEDDSVVLEIQPLVKNVNRVIVTVSGVQYDRTERFRTPTNSELNAIITEEAKKADNTFNY